MYYWEENSHSDNTEGLRLNSHLIVIADLCKNLKIGSILAILHRRKLKISNLFSCFTCLYHEFHSRCTGL